MILETLNRLLEEFENNQHVNIDQLKYIFNNIDKNFIDLEAKARFIDNDKSKGLTEAAITEAENIDLYPEKYESVLKLMMHSHFPGNIAIVRQVVSEYNNGKVAIEKLLADNSISGLARIYSKHHKQISFTKLMLMNVEKSGEKTTFVHALFELPPSKENREAIIKYFMKLNELAERNKELLDSYLTLSDHSGKSILTILAEKSQLNAYNNLEQTIYDSCNFLFTNSFKQKDQRVDTHTTSIHLSVDESLVKLSLNYKSNNIKQISHRFVEVSRDKDWNIRIDSEINNLEAKILEIIKTDESIEAFIQPPKNEREEKISRFIFIANAALRLINGLKEGHYNDGYKILANEVVSCGFTVKEIVAIGFDSLKDTNNWNNPEKVKEHFIQFIENIYVAKRGYNIDRYGKDEWKTEGNIKDSNKCSGGTVNQLVIGLQDHKQVEIRIVDSITMKSPVLIKLPDILKELSNNHENKKLIINWLQSGIITNELSVKIIDALKLDKSFKEEFSLKEIVSFVPSVLNKYTNKELAEQLSQFFPEILGELNTKQDVKTLVHTFTFNDDKGYILYLESLHDKNKGNFIELFTSTLTAGVIINNEFSLEGEKHALLLNLVFSSQNQEFVEEASKIFRTYFSRFTKKHANNLKNNYFILAAENSYHALGDVLIKSGADIDARDKREGHFGKTALSYAIENGDLEVVKYIAEKNPKSLRTPDNYHKLSSHYASKKGHLDVLKYIVKNNPGILLIPDDQDMLPSHYASKNGHLDVLKYIAENNPESLLIPDYQDKLALHYAIENRQFDTIKYIAKNNPEILLIPDKHGKIALHHVIATRDLDTIKYIVKQSPKSLLIPDNQGKIALHCASESGKADVIEYIVDKSPESLLISDYQGNIALDYLLYSSCRLKTVQSIIEKIPESLRIPDSDGKLPLHHAVENGKSGLVQYLVTKYPESLLIPDNKGKLALHYASWNSGLVQYILSIEPQIIDAVDLEGNTVLHLLLKDRDQRLDNCKVIPLIKQLSSIISYINKAGEAAINLYARRTYMDISIFKELLDNTSIDIINSQDQNGNTILHLIFMGNYYSGNPAPIIGQLLLKKGADLTKKNKDKKTAFDLFKQGSKRLSSYDLSNNDLKNFENDCLDYFKNHIEVLNKKEESDFQTILLELKAQTFHLHEAIEQNNEVQLRALLDQGANVNELDQDGYTILHIIASDTIITGDSRERIIQLLVDKGIDLNKRSIAGKTALEIAQEQYEYDNDPIALHIIKILEKYHLNLAGQKRKAEDLTTHTSSSSKISKIDASFINSCKKSQESHNFAEGTGEQYDPKSLDSGTSSCSGKKSATNQALIQQELDVSEQPSNENNVESSQPALMYYVTGVKYNNAILNNPNLLKSAFRLYGKEAINLLIELGEDKELAEQILLATKELGAEKVLEIFFKDMVKISQQKESADTISAVQLRAQEDKTLEAIAKIEAIIGKEALAEITGWHKYVSTALSNNPVSSTATKAIHIIDKLVNYLEEWLDFGSSYETVDIETQVTIIISQLENWFDFVASGITFVGLPPRYPGFNPDDDFDGGSGGGGQDLIYGGSVDNHQNEPAVTFFVGLNATTLDS